MNTDQIETSVKVSLWNLESIYETLYEVRNELLAEHRDNLPTYVSFFDKRCEPYYIVKSFELIRGFIVDNALPIQLEPQSIDAVEALLTEANSKSSDIDFQEDMNKEVSLTMPFSYWETAIELTRQRELVSR
jgi:hypothetical protein